MNPQRAPISETDLHAYVDGRLSAERQAEVEAFLASNPEEAERARAYQKQNEMLAALFDPVLGEPIPDEWRGFKRHWYLPAKRYGALLAAVIVGAVLGWTLRGDYGKRPPEALTFARQAAIAHAVYSPEVRHPVEVSAEEEQHLVNWLSKRLGASLKRPRLSDFGYSLVGGRLLPGERGPVAQFMYEDKSGQRLTLYIKIDPGAGSETAFRFFQQGSVGVFYWLDRQYSYALSGQVEKAELLRIARAIYHQLNP